MTFMLNDHRIVSLEDPHVCWLNPHESPEKPKKKSGKFLSKSTAGEDPYYFKKEHVFPINQIISST